MGGPGLEEQEPEIKYAVQLSGLDIGKRVAWIHKYTYKGEKREKIKEVNPLKRVTHGKKSSWIYYRDEDPGWAHNVRHKINPDTLVAVYDQ